MSSITGVSSINSTNPYLPQNQNGFAQIQKDFQAIGSALQSGDPTSAQSALSTFQSDLKANPNASASQPFGKNNQANTDFQSLISAVQSGDTASAQKAYVSLQTDLKSAQKTHAPHHHHGSGSSSLASVNSTADLATAASSASSDAINSINLTA